MTGVDSGDGRGLRGGGEGSSCMCSMLFWYLMILTGVFGLTGSVLFGLKGNSRYYLCATSETNFLESMMFFFAALSFLVLNKYQENIYKDDEEYYKLYMKVYKVVAGLVILYFLYELYSVVLCMCCESF